MKSCRVCFILLLFFFKSFFSKTITVQQRSRAAGGVIGDGIVKENVDYQYTCQPLDTENREYITCIAIKLKESDDKYGSSRICKCFTFVSSLLDCRDGVVLRALASHQRGPRSIPRSGVMLVLYSAPRHFLRVLQLPLPSKTSI